MVVYNQYEMLLVLP